MAKSAKKKKIKKKVKRSMLRTETKKDILAVVFFCLAILSFLSFFNAAGLFGQQMMRVSRVLFGRGFFLISAAFLLTSLALLLPRLKLHSIKRPPLCKTVLTGMAGLILSVLGFFYLIGMKMQGGMIAAGLDIFTQGKGLAGYVGTVVGYPLFRFFGFWAGLAVLTACLVISVLVGFNISLIPRFLKKENDEPVEGKIDFHTAEEAAQSEKPKKKGLWQTIKEKTALPPPQESQTAGQKESVALPAGAKALAKKKGGFKFPPLDFLEKDHGKPTSGDIKANINIIKRTLENFGIEVEMAEVNVGPTVTQYTLRPAQGIKLSRITALQNDLALALAAHPLRIEAPIPGKSLVGIEIPNRSVVLVRLRDLLGHASFRESPSSLTFALGRDVAGKPIFADLRKMPHLLVAGATGTGKTISLNNLIVSLLYRNAPEDMRLILIDPKRVELSVYDNIPHLLAPVVVRPERAASTLRWAVGEMERRFAVLQAAGQRDIGAYTQQRRENDEHLPYIIIVIDELADLMASYGREMEAGIVRLAQMARAVGIHLIVSTQRPSVEIITGLIKANITSRMALQVASQIDSRTILDMAGAEKLLGQGDMLFLAGNSAKPMRVQGAYISDQEVKKVVNYLKGLAEPEYKDDLAAIQEGRSTLSMELAASTDEAEAGDELYGEAKKVVVQAGKASASLLQRRLRVGYARAARLLDILEDKGIVGPADGAKPRRVFIDEGADMKVEQS